jgi:squalene monooxygenase
MNAMYDICIVGAGVSGASLAAHFSSKDVKVALLDVSFEERDRIVGELMQPGGVFILNQLGLGDVLDNIDACTINGYALFNKDKNIVMDYHDDPSFEGVKGRGLNNGKFIQALRSKSVNKENIDFILGEAIDFIDIENHIEGIVYLDENKENQTIMAKLTIVCDGFFSTLRKKLIPEQKSITSQFVGLVLEDCELPYEGYGHIFMSGDAPFLCYRISDKEVRLLVDFPGDVPLPKGEELKSHLSTKVREHIPESMYHSLDKGIVNGKFKFMPNHYMTAIECKKTGVVMVGDSLNMRHPLTGGGMTAALTDVMLLCKSILQDGCLVSVERLNQKIPKYYEERNAWNASINILADALYKVCLNVELKDACFNYLAKGAHYSKEPLLLLSGLSRDNSTLFKHFIQVALIGAKDNVMGEFGFKSIDNSYGMLKKASQILFPLVMSEKMNILDLASTKNLSKLASA